AHASQSIQARSGGILSQIAVWHAREMATAEAVLVMHVRKEETVGELRRNEPGPLGRAEREAACGGGEGPPKKKPGDGAAICRAEGVPASFAQARGLILAPHPRL